MTVINAQHHATDSAPQHASQTGSPPTIEHERLVEILNRLNGLLEEDDIQALTLWREMSSVLHPALGTLAQQLETELNNYDFEAALHLSKAALSRNTGH